MVTVCLSPIIYFLIRYLKFYFVATIGIMWSFGFNFNLTGLSSISIFYFSLGAWFSINGRIFTNDFISLRCLTCLYLALLILTTFLWYYEIEGYEFICNINIIIGLISVVSWVAYALNRNFIRTNKLLTSSSFFIYAYHAIVIALFIKLYVKLFSKNLSDSVLVIGYFIIPFIIVIIGVGLYAFLRKYFPSFTALITGGR